MVYIHISRLSISIHIPIYGIFTYICHKNQPNVGKYTRVSGWKLVTIVSKLVYFTYLRDLQPTTYKGVIIRLLSTKDIPVVTL